MKSRNILASQYAFLCGLSSLKGYCICISKYQKNMSMKRKVLHLLPSINDEEPFFFFQETYSGKTFNTSVLIRGFVKLFSNLIDVVFCE